MNSISTPYWITNKNCEINSSNSILGKSFSKHLFASFFQVIKIPEHSYAIGLAGRLELNLLLQCKSNLCFWYISFPFKWSPSLPLAFNLYFTIFMCVFDLCIRYVNICTPDSLKEDTGHSLIHWWDWALKKGGSAGHNLPCEFLGGRGWYYFPPWFLC